jgi:hypothetical protein
VGTIELRSARDYAVIAQRALNRAPEPAQPRLFVIARRALAPGRAVDRSGIAIEAIRALDINKRGRRFEPNDLPGRKVRSDERSSAAV